MDSKVLTSREVYGVIRGAASGMIAMRRVSPMAWGEIHHGMMTIDADGWVITFHNHCDSLDYCDSCYSPDGRAYDYSSPLNQGTDPVQLLSSTERHDLESRLSAA